MLTHSGPRVTIEKRTTEEHTKSNEPTEYEQRDIRTQASMATAAWAQFGVLVGELVLLFFTVVFAWWAYRQAKEGAQTARKLLDSQNLGESAWLCPGAFNSNKGREDGRVTKMYFHPLWANRGKTPAFRAHFHSNWKVVAADTDINTVVFPRPDAWPNWDPGYAVGPDQSVFGSDIVVPIDDILRVARHEIELLLYVRSEYDDVFGGKHESVACYQWAYLGPIESLTDPRNPIPKEQFRYYPVGRLNWMK